MDCPKRQKFWEAGSGGGVEPTPTLARRGRLTGVDISAEQIRLASARVPHAQFIHGDPSRRSTSGMARSMRSSPLRADARAHAMATAPDQDLNRALEKLAASPSMPATKGIVSTDGSVSASLVEAVHRWYSSAIELSRATSASKPSLAIPTWHYGHEPPTPFATHIGKYFQNSIREDGLLAVAKHGMSLLRKGRNIGGNLPGCSPELLRKLWLVQPDGLVGPRLLDYAVPGGSAASCTLRRREALKIREGYRFGRGMCGVPHGFRASFMTKVEESIRMPRSDS